MAKVFLFMMVSLDGYFEGEDHDLSWHNVDDEFNSFAISKLDNASTLVFGGTTYKLMASYWPTEFGKKDSSEVARKMNSLHKVVFSKSLKEASWNNTDLYSGNVSKVINELKAKSDKDIEVMGSSNLCLTLIKEKVLEELLIMINPVAIGKGTTLFSGLTEPLKLSLKNSQEFKSGNVLLTYKVDY